MQRVLHATMGESHLYKFIGERKLAELRFNGSPIDTDFLPAPSGTQDRFLRFEEPLVTLTRVVMSDVYHLVRNDRPNPFAFEMPDTFANPEERKMFALDHGVAQTDHDGEVRYDLLSDFYRTERDESSVEREVPFEVREIGEIAPCPEVGFSWEPIQPHDAGVPPEMWHLGPVQVTSKTLKELFWQWVRMEEKNLCIKSMYPNQEGASVYFEVPGSDRVTSIKVHWVPEFMSLFTPVMADNLNDLDGKVKDRMAALQEMMIGASPVHQCPRCSGAGSLTCPRCGGDGMTDTGLQAKLAIQAVVDKVMAIKGSRGNEATQNAVAAVRGLKRFMLPGDPSE